MTRSLPFLVVGPLTDRLWWSVKDRNNSLRPRLEHLRAETGSAFQEARELKEHWLQVEQEQRRAYQVRLGPEFRIPKLTRQRVSIR
jgi:hypothetical protein